MQECILEFVSHHFSSLVFYLNIQIFINIYFYRSRFYRDTEPNYAFLLSVGTNLVLGFELEPSSAVFDLRFALRISDCVVRARCSVPQNWPICPLYKLLLSVIEIHGTGVCYDDAWDIYCALVVSETDSFAASVSSHSRIWAFPCTALHNDLSGMLHSM